MHGDRCSGSEQHDGIRQRLVTPPMRGSSTRDTCTDAALMVADAGDTIDMAAMCKLSVGTVVLSHASSSVFLLCSCSSRLPGVGWI
jgi:hypothetical protein